MVCSLGRGSPLSKPGCRQPGWNLMENPANVRSPSPIVISVLQFLFDGTASLVLGSLQLCACVTRTMPDFNKRNAVYEAKHNFFSYCFIEVVIFSQTLQSASRLCETVFAFMSVNGILVPKGCDSSIISSDNYNKCIHNYNTFLMCLKIIMK